MALPPQAIERLTQESSHEPGWSGRMLMLSSVILFLALVTWLGLKYGYNKFLSEEATKNDAVIEDLGKQDEVKQNNILAMYSQVNSLTAILNNHTYGTAILSYLQRNTHPNAYIVNASYVGSGNQLNISGVGHSAKDVAQQLSILGKDPATQSLKLNNVRNQGGGLWGFEAVITIDPKLITSRPTQEEMGDNAQNASSSASIQAATSTNSSAKSTSTKP